MTLKRNFCHLWKHYLIIKYMTIAICGSLKFYDAMQSAASRLHELGHTTFVPVHIEGVDYWSEDSAKRIEAKKGKDLIREHFHKIEKADAILVVNMTKREIENYIGANTFLEIGFAHILHKQIYVLNPLPTQQPYIIEELTTMHPIVLHGDVSKIQKI